MKFPTMLALGLLIGLGQTTSVAASEPPPDAAPAEADAPPPSKEVLELLQNADAAFEEGRLLDAWDAIDEAESLQPGPFYEFMRGLIRQAQGRCDRAVEHWDRYLKSNPDPADAAEVQRLIEQCGGLPEPPPEAVPVDPEPTSIDPKTDPASPPKGDATTDTTPMPRPWHRDVAGGVLLGTGIAALAAGGGLLAGAGVLANRAPDGALLMDHDGDIQRARALSYASIAASAVGVGLLVGATIRYVRIKRRSRSGARAVRWPSQALVRGH